VGLSEKGIDPSAQGGGWERKDGRFCCDGGREGV
jgi:hypothetical protein